MLEGLKQSKKPKLFVLGKQDILVKPEVVKTAYEKASEPKVLYTLDSGHDYKCHPELIEQINGYIGTFLAEKKYG